MRSAPPVLVPVGRFVWGERMALGLAMVTLLVLLVWLWQMGAQPRLLMASLSAWLAMAVLSRWMLQRQTWPVGQLRWDGEAWYFESGAATSLLAPVHVHAVWDGGSSLCLRLSTERSQGYAWLRACDVPSAWHGLRCALYQRDTL